MRVLADLHMNDPEFASIVAGCMEQLLQGRAPKEVAAGYGAA